MRRMRGEHREPDSMFSYVSPERRIPKDHPLRAIRALVDEALVDMSREFDRLYATIGRPSIPPERLLRAQLLQIFYSIRSERLLMERLDSVEDILDRGVLERQVRIHLLQRGVPCFELAAASHPTRRPRRTCCAT